MHSGADSDTGTTDDFVRIRLALVERRREGVAFEQAFAEAIERVVPAILDQTMRAKQRAVTREILRATLDAWRDGYEIGRRKMAEMSPGDVEHLRAAA